MVLAARIHHRPWAELRRPLRYGAVGLASTVSYLAVFAMLRGLATAEIANLAAVSVTTTGNTAINRRFTFGVRGSESRWRAQLAGLLGSATSLALSALVLLGADSGTRPVSEARELVALLLAGAAAATLRYALLVHVLAGSPASPPSGGPVRALWWRRLPQRRGLQNSAHRVQLGCPDDQATIRRLIEEGGGHRRGPEPAEEGLQRPRPVDQAHHQNPFGTTRAAGLGEQLQRCFDVRHQHAAQGRLTVREEDSVDVETAIGHPRSQPLECAQV